MIVALACTGRRIGELASLRWSDLDFSKSILSLTDETASPAKRRSERRTTKTGHSRSFPIHADLLMVLENKLRRGPQVFYGPKDGRLKPDTVRNVLIREVLRPLQSRFPKQDDTTGFADGRLHSFRHYFCSTCANNGIPQQMVMHWLGHRSSEMVRHYYHLHDGEAKRRMRQLNFLGSSSGRSTDANQVPEAPEC